VFSSEQAAATESCDCRLLPADRTSRSEPGSPQSSVRGPGVPVAPCNKRAARRRSGCAAFVHQLLQRPDPATPSSWRRTCCAWFELVDGTRFRLTSRGPVEERRY